VAGYSVQIKASAAKELDRLPRKKDRQRIVDRIQKLADDPRPPGCKKISGRDLYRIRQGSFRIVYSVRDDVLIVLVVKVADRKEVYRGNP
jgi:mRNA interferase RelE/StbE